MKKDSRQTVKRVKQKIKKRRIRMEENGKERSKPPRPLISYCIKPSFNEKENIYLKTKKKTKKKNARP